MALWGNESVCFDTILRTITYVYTWEDMKSTLIPRDGGNKACFLGKMRMLIIFIANAVGNLQLPMAAITIWTALVIEGLTGHF